MRITKIIAIAIPVLALASCATITRGTKTDFTVQTTPGGAAVSTTNGFSCAATPCSFKMPRKSQFSVTITKPGYKTYTGNVINKISGAGGAGMAGNVIVGGIIGVGVDASSGAMLDLVPNPLIVTLEAEDPAASADKPYS
ncbi:PEGA domain-containing protein [Candidatus Phycosocius spiralis]|uniref:PEGA domain-containing protein n=1 Tax=Candidatus Phycosocius spiralis TaxID=2815099 RepID=A0ABQ4PXD3_9PROT|nr:PEGA domain-containing protein [Candidatus Phycosocius spiralis]GIU67580.1 hypothetical protein PsB1_1734 [Candidatus Phycosocius spiralis]